MKIDSNNQDVQGLRFSEKWDSIIDNKGNRIEFDATLKLLNVDCKH